MIEIPGDVLTRRDGYCSDRDLTILDLRGFGLEGYVWQTTQDTILKIARHRHHYLAERDVYRRLADASLYRLQGFSIPCLIDSSDRHVALELSYVKPPYILDFAAATLDSPPTDFNLNDPDWLKEKSRLFGTR